MPRTYGKAVGAVATVALLALLALLGGCAGQSGSAREAEVEALRARVERLERENAEERARLAEDIRAMREDMANLRTALDGLAREVNALSGAPDSGHQNGTAAKSPRQALKDSLRGFVDSSKQTIDRLTKELEHSLSRPKQRDKTPETPVKEGTQI